MTLYGAIRTGNLSAEAAVALGVVLEGVIPRVKSVEFVGSKLHEDSCVAPATLPQIDAILAQLSR